MYYSSEDQNNTGELNIQTEQDRWKTEHHDHHHKTGHHHMGYAMPYMMAPMSYCPSMETCPMKSSCPMIDESNMMPQMDPDDPDPRFGRRRFHHFHHHVHHHFFHHRMY
ncbi:hypothetical protein [Candidatus Clostridium stratigraminis]|uniref:Histidine-rich glycoprotein-like n=1 Tax=Candidatus Clostridium stratigraminis TaxID=3381661 RepID=A0ABW8T789_9CLOT